MGDDKKNYGAVLLYDEYNGVKTELVVFYSEGDKDNFDCANNEDGAKAAIWNDRESTKSELLGMIID